MNDEIYYLEATNEFDSENLDEALWAKLMALLEGNTEKAKYEYIKTRAERLITESVNGLEEASVESESQKHEEPTSQSESETQANDLLKRDFMPLSEFSSQKGIAEPKVIKMIREGFYVGRKVGEDWFVSREDLRGSNNQPKSQDLSKPKAPQYITAKEFAEAKNLDELKVVQMIRDGFYSGRLINDAWHIESSELKEGIESSHGESFFERLIKGEFGLPIHYWLFALVGNMLINFAFSGFESVRNYNGILFVLGVSIIYNFPVLIGLWRAAVNYTGPTIWKILVLISSVLGWIGLLGNTLVLVKAIN